MELLRVGWVDHVLVRLLGDILRLEGLPRRLDHLLVAHHLALDKDLLSGGLSVRGLELTDAGHFLLSLPKCLEMAGTGNGRSGEGGDLLLRASRASAHFPVFLRAIGRAVEQVRVNLHLHGLLRLLGLLR